MDTADPSPIRPILTLTINPALDVSTSTAVVRGEHKLRCTTSRLDPGGGGINVARVVHHLGGHALALYAAGGPTGAAFRHLIEATGVPTLLVPISGSTRECFTVDETSTGNQYRFVLDGPEVRDAEWRAFLDHADESMPQGGLVVASGSIPPGVPVDFYARVARLARAHESHCIVDASGPALAAALDEGVFLVKPSARELSELSNRELSSPSGQIAAAEGLVREGSARWVALTLGGDGAVLVSADGVWRVSAPPVHVSSTVGAGDSFVGAFVLRLSQGWDPADALRSAVAAGTAAAITPATELCHRTDVERLEHELRHVDRADPSGP